MHLEQRIDNYVRETHFPRSLFISEDGRIVGTWIMGNDYRVKTGMMADIRPATYDESVRYSPTNGECFIYSVGRSI